MAATTEGLRERKKRQTREVIARAAMRLFVARGFDEVTVADVARAADVSEKTVFNYFPAKEDLVLHGGEERRAALIEAIRTRPAGTSIVELFRARWRMWPAVAYTLLLLATWILGFIDELVHAKDTWATMPGGLVLSAIVVVLACLTLAFAWAGLRTGVAP